MAGHRHPSEAFVEIRFPWSEEVRAVVETKPRVGLDPRLRLYHQIHLQHLPTGVRALITDTGGVYIQNEWRIQAHTYARLDLEDSREFGEFVRSCVPERKTFWSDDYLDCLAQWAGVHIPLGKKEWRPSIPRSWQAAHASGARRDFPDVNLFSITFHKYSHEMSADGIALYPYLGTRESGLSPEVWYGNIREFVLHAQDSWSWGRMNQFFHNGILWALAELGVFSPGWSIPDWVHDEIRRDPDLLWSELVEKLWKEKETLYPFVQEALDLWVDRHGEPRP